MSGAWQLTAGQVRVIKAIAFLACTEPAVARREKARRR
jgi:hypothetical protein